MKIGLISIWFSRGQAFVTHTFRDVLKNNHEVFVFARTGIVFGERKMSHGGIWEVPNLTRYPEYKINPEHLIKWIQDNKIDLVVFNEEYDFNLVHETKKATGVKVVTYLDFYADKWKKYMSIYDDIWCSTQRSFELAKQFDTKVSYIGWGVDTELFKPHTKTNIRTATDGKFTFFHNAGWIGNNYRKMTPAVILTFNEASKHNLDISLLVHAQAGLEKLPERVVDIIKENNRIEYRIETVPQPGYYNEGKILLFVSKLEGLGLPLLEGLSCGLPAIATDEPPMNEFVKDQYNGDIIPVIDRVTRHDNIAFPEAIIDADKLVDIMLSFQNRPEKSINARQFIMDNFTLEHLQNNIEKTL